MNLSIEADKTPPLIPYFMLSPGSLLLRAENLKGAPLTEPEVLKRHLRHALSMWCAAPTKTGATAT